MLICKAYASECFFEPILGMCHLYIDAVSAVTCLDMMTEETDDKRISVI